MPFFVLTYRRNLRLVYVENRLGKGKKIGFKSFSQSFSHEVFKSNLS